MKIEECVFLKATLNVMNNYLFEFKGGWKFTFKLPEMLLSSLYFTAVEIGLVPRQGMEISF